MKKNLQTTFSTRQYMLSEDFEVYYYNEHYSTSVKSHTHDYYEFYFFIEGHMSYEIQGKMYPLSYGDVVLVPPGTLHHAVARDKEVPYRRFVFWISRDYVSQLLELSPAYGYLLQYTQQKGEYIFHNDRITFNSIQTKVLHLLEETHSGRFGREARIQLCVGDLVLYLNRVVYERNHSGKKREEGSLFENLTDYIEDHLEEELSLNQLAEAFYVSKYYIAHMFKEQIGLSVHQYITKKRVAACRDAIRNHVKISEAYLMFGFKDYSSFYRAFRKEYGMSPKEYEQAGISDFYK